MLFKIVACCVLAVAASFAVEAATNAFLKKERQSRVRRLAVLLCLNAAVWGACLAVYFPDPLSGLLLCLGFDVLLCIALSDHDTQTIPNVFLLVLLALAVAYAALDKTCPWTMHVFGCGMGYLPLFLMRFFGEKIAKQETMGAGDVYLSGILGLYLGLMNYLLCGIVTGIAALIAIGILRRRKAYDPMHRYAFSPFFAFGYAVTVVCGGFLLGAWI